MKSLIMAVSFSFLAQTAVASYFQINCSTADQRAAFNTGHSENVLRLVTVQSTNEGPKKEIIELSTENIDAREAEVVLLQKSESTTCKPGDQAGVAQTLSLNFQKTVFKRFDGKNFPAGSPGISADGKTLELDLLCHSDYNGLVLCD